MPDATSGNSSAQPKAVFDNPGKYWDFLTVESDDEIEGQYFDRKEVGRPREKGFVRGKSVRKVKEKLQRCISAFANANPEGGLLILGISSDGNIRGTNQLTEDQLSDLLSFGDLLKNCHTKVREFKCSNVHDEDDSIYLVYVHYTSDAVCRTKGFPSKAWRRVGPRSEHLDRRQLRRLERDKGIVDFERRLCCPYQKSEVDENVLERYIQSRRAGNSQNARELLFEIGALDRKEDEYYFTNAGYLFFASNPQRKLSNAYIRLLRFEVESHQEKKRGLPTHDQDFTGSIPQQIRKIRAFFRESGFFKTYQSRNPDGGFKEEPELPYIAVDEAIVNAVAHRDYGENRPVKGIHYRNAFSVENPGLILQRSERPPEEFSLDTFTLHHEPRNPMLIQWLKEMQDDEGGHYVQALSEGTTRMQAEMEDLGLPSPLYKTADSQTKVILYSNATEREAQFRTASAIEESTQHANLFRMDLYESGGKRLEAKAVRNRQKEVLTFLKDALTAQGWFIDYFAYGKIVAHRKGANIDVKGGRDIVRFYPAYEMRFRNYWKKLYLCIDYTLQVKNIRNLCQLVDTIKNEHLKGKVAVVKTDNDDWQRGKVLEANREHALIWLFDEERELRVHSDFVIPDLPPSLVKKVMRQEGRRFDLSKAIKKHSLSGKTGTARERAEKTTATAELLSKSVFPLEIGGITAMLKPAPVPLHQRDTKEGLQVRSLPEPTVEFSRQRESSDIREGITKYGIFDEESQEIEIVPICTRELRNEMASLIQRLKVGKYKYKGSERTFHSRLSYSSIITVPTAEEVLSECKRLLKEHPGWVGNKELHRIFLVHTPTEGYESDDVSSPYYQVKRLLLEKGIPCQMVDTTTLLNADWKDLNLALNIATKCGRTPWVLPNSIPDADFFVGLSYTRSRKKGAKRLVGFATVFNSFGKWEFYSGKQATFSYEERSEYFAKLTKRTLKQLSDSLPGSPSIYFHYSAKFSRENREAILEAARSVRPSGTYSFVSLNDHHNLRLYDSRPETDGSLSRGSYVTIAHHQIILSTTGYNPFGKTRGTPKPLEITIWREKPDGTKIKDPDLKSLAVQILSLTKLNWASSGSIVSEPITTKYARDIAYLTDAFLRQEKGFELHPVLEETPWFV